jgi:hypothetical protein
MNIHGNCAAHNVIEQISSPSLGPEKSERVVGEVTDLLRGIAHGPTQVRDRTGVAEEAKGRGGSDTDLLFSVIEQRQYCRQNASMSLEAAQSTNSR